MEKTDFDIDVQHHYLNEKDVLRYEFCDYQHIEQRDGKDDEKNPKTKFEENTDGEYTTNSSLIDCFLKHHKEFRGFINECLKNRFRDEDGRAKWKEVNDLLHLWLRRNQQQ